MPNIFLVAVSVKKTVVKNVEPKSQELKYGFREHSSLLSYMNG